MPRQEKVYMIGFMGSGKTTRGAKLAGMLGWKFADLDRLVEASAGMGIPEIFSVHGEEYFRNLESELLRSLGNEGSMVISTGGGTPCFSDNMDYMISTGLTVYLKLTPGQIRSRISGTGTERPLIKDLDESSLLAFIEDKLALREKWYNRAELTVDGFDTDISELCLAVKARITD